LDRYIIDVQITDKRRKFSLENSNTDSEIEKETILRKVGIMKLELIIWLTAVIFWCACGFIAWGFQDGSVTIKHAQLRHTKIDFHFVIFDLLFGPMALISTYFTLGCKYWTRRFWSKKRKNGWEMLLKLED
jgi:hypothetical protein